MNEPKNLQNQMCDTKTVNKTSGIKKEFNKSLTNICMNKFLSDVTLRIFEGAQDETDKHNEDADNKIERCNEEVSFPVQSLVLRLNRKVFEKLLHNTTSSLKNKYEKEYNLNGNPGDSKYVELHIHSFNDFDLLNNIGLSKLLNILEIGDRYMCDALHKQGSSVVEYDSVATINECNSVLDRLAFYESSLNHVLTKDFLVSCCTHYLIKSFTPLECVGCGELPNKLHFSSLLMLLKSNDGFAFHENSVMTFVLNWLEADESRQTEQNIEALLAECRYEHMDGQFLKTVLSRNNPILCKWSGFLDWYVDAVENISCTNHNNLLCKRLNRSLKTEFIETFCSFGTSKPHIRSFKDKEKIEYHGYSLKMEFNKDKKKWISDKWIIYNGYILQPAIFSSGKENNFTLEMYLGKEDERRQLKDFNLKIPFSVRFFANDQNNPDFPRHHEIEFLECNRTESSVDYISKEICDKSSYTCILLF